MVASPYLFAGWPFGLTYPGRWERFWQGEVWWHGYSLRLPGTDNLYTVLTRARFCLAATLRNGALMAIFQWSARANQGVAAGPGIFRRRAWLFWPDVHRLRFSRMLLSFARVPLIFTSGRLLLGALIPFLLVFVCGLDRVLRRQGRTIKFVTLMALVGGMLALEIFTDRTVFASPYNWYHLPPGDLMPAGQLQATCLYWDRQADNPQSPYLGDLSGTWENPLWSDSATGQPTPASWTNGEAVCFGAHTGLSTPPFAVLMNSNHAVAALFDGSLGPNSCDVTVYGSGVMTLPSGLDVFAIHNASDGSLGTVTISNVIAGPGVLNPRHEGQLYLHGSNTWTGGTSLGIQ